MKTFLTTFILTLFLQSAPAEDATTKALALDYKAFDQTQHSGWRVLAQDEKRHREAATLIDAYLAKHSELNRFDRANLNFHALQCLAMAGDNAEALKHLPASRLDPEPPESPICWNDYLEATEAFLKRDRPKLLAVRKRMATQKPDDGNLPIVDSLIAHFDEPYAKAYGKAK